MENQAAIDMLKRGFLDCYQEGLRQGFLMGQKDPVQSAQDAFLKAYPVSKTKQRIEAMVPTEGSNREETEIESVEFSEINLLCPLCSTMTNITNFKLGEMAMCSHCKKSFTPDATFIEKLKKV